MKFLQKFNFFYQIVWFLVSLRTCKGQNNGEYCEIGGEVGRCVILSVCDQYVALLKNPATTLEGLQVTRARQCGFEGQNQKVCCPETVIGSDRSESRRNESNNDFVEEFPSFANCGRMGTKASFVFNGKPVTNRQMAKWMALLGYKDAPSFWQCGGSLITTKHVLTAAHCIKRNLYLVRLGELDLEEEEKDYSPVDLLIKRTIRHEQYTKYHNDIAVVVLDGAIKPYDYDHIEPVCLPLRSNANLDMFDTKHTFVTGWGETENRGERSTKLLYANLTILDLDFCARAFSGRNVVIDERVLCAGDPEGQHDACNGDSGGPLINKYDITADGFTSSHHYQLGIVSYGFRCSARRFTGVYTSVAHFMPWLEEKVLGRTAQGY